MVKQTPFSKGQRTRLKLLEDAIESFVENGFEGSSISELARRSKMNRALIGHYFGSKENLIQEALQLMGSTGKSSTDLYLKVRKDVKDPIQRYILATLNWLREYPTHARFLILSIQRASYDTKTRIEVAIIFETAWQRLTEVIENERTNGKYSTEDSFGAAKQVHSLLLGTMLSWMSHQGTDLADEENRCIQGAMVIVGAHEE